MGIANVRICADAEAVAEKKNSRGGMEGREDVLVRAEIMIVIPKARFHRI